MAYELACGTPPFVSDNHFELATKHDREAVDPPSQRGSRLGPKGDSIVHRFLAKAPSDRFENLEMAVQAIDELHAGLSSKAKSVAPYTPILGDASLIRYATGTTDSMISFVADTSNLEDAPEGSSVRSGPTSLEDTILGGSDSESQPLTGEATKTPEQIGRYTIVGLLGRGGMGTVYVAFDQALKRELALKTIDARFQDSPTSKARFFREAELLARLDHPNFVRIYDFGTLDDGTCYSALELVRGVTLGQRLRERPWQPTEVARLMATIARAVHYAHSVGVVHRDMKPDNVILTEDGIPKVVDFGLAKLIEEPRDVVDDRTERGTSWDDGQTLQGTVLGTPSYMAPEQVVGDIARVGAATDVHALGAMLYELLTGRTPFKGEGSLSDLMARVMTDAPDPPSRWRRGVPRDLDAICLKCLEKDPERRYSTAAALADDLERFLAGQPIAARPRGGWDRLRRLFSFKKSPAG